MCTKSRIFANTGLVNISQANPSLNGSGPMGLVLTGANNGTAVNFIMIKARGNTSEGMIRLFVFNGLTYFLYKEVYVPANTQTSVVTSWGITFDEELSLDAGSQLFASTEIAESFNVLANSSTWENCVCSATASCNDVMSVANTGLVNIFQANKFLDGSGPMGTIISSPSGINAGGTSINEVIVKATGNTTEGMIRIFVNTGGAAPGSNLLITEIPVANYTQSAVEPAFRTAITLDLHLQAGYSLRVSTQNAESFNIITNAADLINCPC